MGYFKAKETIYFAKRCPIDIEFSLSGNTLSAKKGDWIVNYHGVPVRVISDLEFRNTFVPTDEKSKSELDEAFSH